MLYAGHYDLRNVAGLVSKHRDRPCCADRSPHWIQVNNRKSPAKALLDANEIGCARIFVMAGEQLPPPKGPIQMSRTNYLQTFKFGLQPTAGPYRCATS